MRKKIIGINVTTGSYEKFISILIASAKKRVSSYVCVANVHMLVEAHKDPHFANLVNSAEVVTPDGMPIVIAMDWLYGVKQQRVDGMSLMPDLLLEAMNHGLKVFFYGSTEEVLSKIITRCRQLYPSLQTLGYSPPFRTLTDIESAELVKKINDSGAHFIFVALGCPKQEKWMAAMKGKINGVMIGLGGAFPVFAGIQTRAPQWMQQSSLEWVYRLCQEPKRLWKRYVVTNSIFLFLLSIEFVKQKLNNR